MQIVTESMPLADDMLVVLLEAAPDAMVCTAANGAAAQPRTGIGLR
jgi:hypothetical protein